MEIGTDQSFAINIDEFSKGSSFAYQADGDFLLDWNCSNCVVYVYLSANCSVELPVARPGMWLIIQNATPTSSNYTLTITSANMWSGASSSVTASNFISLRAMDKDGAFLWRDMGSSSGMVAE